MQGQKQAKHGSVSIETKIQGTIHHEPLLVLDAHRLEHVALTAFMVTIALENAKKTLVAPVKEQIDGCCLNQVPADGWNRLLPPAKSGHPALPTFFPPVIVSARNAWSIKDSQINVYSNGHIIDGACRLEVALQTQTPTFVPAVVLFGLTDNEELNLFRKLNRHEKHKPNQSTTKVFGIGNEKALRILTNPATPQMVVSNKWINFTIESEPFIIYANSKYIPAIMVRRPNASQHEHLFIGAKSLVKPLEELRVKHGGLKNQTVTVKKIGLDQFAPYIVTVQ